MLINLQYRWTVYLQELYHMTQSNNTIISYTNTSTKVLHAFGYIILKTIYKHH
jgi:hypothetical protein